MKRILDVVLLFPLCLLAIFLLPIIAMAIWLDDGGPVFFWSQRVGQNGKTFWMLKFRSMRVGTPIQATDRIENPQNSITLVGAILRKTSLDELPQLWNIFKGEMSFVGPRPSLLDQSNLNKSRAAYSISRLLPGITGWAQVNGRDNLSDHEKLDLDLFYLKNESFLLDLKIILVTTSCVLSRRGVAH